MRLTYYYRPGCSLCPSFLDALEITLKRLKIKANLIKINIDHDSNAQKLYNDKIPVLEINGVLAHKYHLNIKSLEKQLVKLLK